MDKVTVMRSWLDKQQSHHEKLNKERKNLIDELYTDVMKQVRSFIENRGWDETKNYMSSWIEKATGTNMVGPHHLRNSYIMVLEKMTSLDNKPEPKLQKEFDKLQVN